MKEDIILVIGYTLKDAKYYSKLLNNKISNTKIILSSLNSLKFLSFENKRIEIFLTHKAFIYGDIKKIDSLRKNFLLDRESKIKKYISSLH